MSEQDAETGSEKEAGPSEDADTESRPQDVDEELSEIAEAPDGDLDAALAGIVSGADDAGMATGTVERPDPDAVVVDEALVGEIDGQSPETLALTVELLGTYVDRLEEAVAEEHERAEELESRLKRKQADFQNYKKRQKERMEKEKERATEELITRLLDVRDNLDRALNQEEGAEIRGGVESTLEQFDRELARENVEPIEPEPGDEVDPKRHEVLATIASDQPADTIAQVHRTGYEMAGKVLRPAQVAVSDGSIDGADDGDTGEADAEDGDTNGTDEGADQTP